MHSASVRPNVGSPLIREDVCSQRICVSMYVRVSICTYRMSVVSSDSREYSL